MPLMGPRQMSGLKTLILALAAALAAVLCAGCGGKPAGSASSSGVSATVDPGHASGSAPPATLVSWKGHERAGELSFATTHCVVTNGRLVYFQSPADASDDTAPQVTGSQVEAEDGSIGWSASVSADNFTTFLGVGKAGDAGPDHVPIEAQFKIGEGAGSESFSGTINVVCTLVTNV